MSFWDRPIVDKNSERSEESVLRVRSEFTQKNGFIARDETPDYGVDLNVELISDRGATSHIFAVQIKSSAKVNFIEHKGVTYISMPFKTSRLGHLCNRPPAYGLITVYDEASQTTYYDFVEDIVNRLSSEREGEEWKGLDEIHIHLPLDVLNNESIRRIHEKMSMRFNDHSMLLNAFGHLYHIPSLEERAARASFDINDPRQVEKFLNDHGIELFDGKDFQTLVNLFARLSSGAIINSSGLTLLAAITFGQAGMIIECDYYLQRSKGFLQQYDDHQKFMIDYFSVIVDYKKGNISPTKLSEVLAGLRDRSQNTLNTLTIEINMIYIRFIDRRDNSVDQAMLTTINEVFPKIDAADLSKTDKMLLKLFNLENLHNYGANLFLRDAGRFKVQQQLKIHVPMEERLARLKAVLIAVNTATIQTDEILKDSVKADDKIVAAFASYYRGRFFFHTQFNSMMLTVGEENPHVEDKAQMKSLYANILSSTYYSVDLFDELSMLHEAYLSLCCAYELNTLYRLIHNDTVGEISLEQIEARMEQLERTTGIHKYQPIVEKTFTAISWSAENIGSKWSDVSDDDAEKYAKIALEAFGLPEERLANIVTEVNAHRMFDTKCENPDLELIVDLRHTLSKETHYAWPPVFMIQSKKSGFTTTASQNIDIVLDQVSTILKRN